MPRVALAGIGHLAELFAGRYGRTEGAHVLVEHESGRILVVRTTYLGGEWMLPGGRVERGETPHAAAVREVREETGLAVHLSGTVCVDARRRSSVSFIFVGTAIGGELTPQLGEISEVAWASREEIGSTSPKLHRLLELIGAGDSVRYLGLDEPV